MGVYKTIESKRKAQFESHKLNRIHNFFGTVSGFSTEFIDLKGDEDESGFVFPNNSTAHVQLNVVAFKSGSFNRFLSQQMRIVVDGSGATTVSTAGSFPSIITDESSTSTFTLAEDNGVLKLQVTNDVSVDVNIHATVEFLAYTSDKGFTNAV